MVANIRFTALLTRSCKTKFATVKLMSNVVLYCWCQSDSASVLLNFTFLSHLFSLPCGAGSTVPREGFDSSVIIPFFWCVVAVALPI